jgi:hypothetical protein
LLLTERRHRESLWAAPLFRLSAKPDWFLAGLGHYVNAGGSALLYFLIDHPEEDPVLDTIVVKGWLPDKCGGNTEEYANTRQFYLRAALFHLT